MRSLVLLPLLAGAAAALKSGEDKFIGNLGASLGGLASAASTFVGTVVEPVAPLAPKEPVSFVDLRARSALEDDKEREALRRDMFLLLTLSVAGSKFEDQDPNGYPLFSERESKKGYNSSAVVRSLSLWGPDGAPFVSRPKAGEPRLPAAGFLHAGIYKVTHLGRDVIVVMFPGTGQGGGEFAKLKGIRDGAFMPESDLLCPGDVPGEAPDTELHKGLLLHYLKIAAPIKAALRKLAQGGVLTAATPVYFTGHSMGGATAEFAAYDFACHDYLGGVAGMEGRRLPDGVATFAALTVFTRPERYQRVVPAARRLRVYRRNSGTEVKGVLNVVLNYALRLLAGLPDLVVAVPGCLPGPLPCYYQSDDDVLELVSQRDFHEPAPEGAPGAEEAKQAAAGNILKIPGVIMKAVSSAVSQGHGMHAYEGAAFSDETGEGVIDLASPTSPRAASGGKTVSLLAPAQARKEFGFDFLLDLNSKKENAATTQTTPPATPLAMINATTKKPAAAVLSGGPTSTTTLAAATSGKGSGQGSASLSGKGSGGSGGSSSATGPAAAGATTTAAPSTVAGTQSATGATGGGAGAAASCPKFCHDNFAKGMNQKRLACESFEKCKVGCHGECAVKEWLRPRCEGWCEDGGSEELRQGSKRCDNVKCAGCDACDTAFDAPLGRARQNTDDVRPPIAAAPSASSQLGDEVARWASTAGMPGAGTSEADARKEHDPSVASALRKEGARAVEALLGGGTSPAATGATGGAGSSTSTAKKDVYQGLAVAASVEESNDPAEERRTKPKQVSEECQKQHWRGIRAGAADRAAAAAAVGNEHGAAHWKWTHGCR
eukprot:g2130.t1